MQRFVKLPSFQGVAAGADCSLNLPIGPTYDNIILELTNVTLAQLKDIEVRIAGKPTMRFKDGNELDRINKFWGRGASANGRLMLHFLRPEMASPELAKLFSLGTQNVPTLSLHATIDAGATSPAIVAYATLGEVRQNLGIITKVRRFAYASAVTGEVEISDLPKNGARIVALHLVKADINAVKVDIDTVNVYDASKALGEQVQTQNGRTPQTSYMTHVDFIALNLPGEAVRTQGVQDLRVKPTFGTSGALDIVAEYFDALEGM